ncbi:small RNA degrading nuclease 1-like isoform X1 [Phoenix dactylifera]|uniref:Small RNA degrading nuclease 1-like isoform X1 n=1 Tax=Phoenix dactylifera TaxID=42345 RepID=A0A8B8ZKG9_PHODC|nr:small RNA degrading nuclease 1-like isoform X1 [Phoenix dactylifera]
MCASVGFAGSSIDMLNATFYFVLAEIVKFTQKQGLKGGKGGWKDFLHSHDRRFGAGVSDPARRTKEILVAFLQTFEEKHLKFFDKMIRRLADCKAIKKFITDFPVQETPLQRLVRLTMEHSLFSRCYSFPSHEEEWIIIPLGKVSEAMKSKVMLSIDCEMVLCEDGTEAIVKVCAVDHNLEVKLDELVNPNKAVADYRTDITGIYAEDLEGVTCSLPDIQKSFKKLLSRGTILVGHGVHNDLRVLKIDHPRIIDTSYIFKCGDLPTVTPSLNNLCKSVLGSPVRQKGEPHDCLNDAKAAMKLVLAKLEYGFDDPISVLNNNLSVSDQAKLLLHNIPVDVPYQDLLRLFPEKYNVDIENDLKVRGPSYATFAVFKDAREAYEAFKGIEAPERRDSSGRPQKNVFLETRSGKSISLHVRRMTAAAPLDGHDPLNKRWHKMEMVTQRRQHAKDETNDSKKPRTSLHYCEHVKEIEKLKEELCQREDEIFELQKMIAALARKNGL